MVDFLGFNRVTNTSRANAFNLDRRRLDSRIFDSQRMLSSGKRVLVPSDDPVAATRALALERLLEDNGQFASNIEQGNNRLLLSEDAVSDLNEIVNRVRELVLTHTQSTFDTNTRLEAATEVDRLLEEAVAIANRKFGDEFLFAGTNVLQRPFVGVGDFFDYTGNDVELTTRIADGQSAAVSISGARAFGALTNQVTGDVDLDPNMSGATRLSELNGGRGVSRGQIRIVSGAVTSVVDLTDADDVQDVIDRLVASGAVAAAAIDGATGDRLVLTGVGATIQIDEIGGTNTARDLGILATAPVASPFTGADVDPVVGKQTTVANLRNGAGLSGPPTALTITNGINTAVVDLSAATTVEDVLNQINRSGLHVTARINAAGDGIDVVSHLQGARLTIAEAGGTTAAELGLLLTLPEQELDDLNGGQGVLSVPGNDFRITAKDAATIDVDISLATTVQDVIDLINSDAENGGRVVAGFLAGTDQLQLTDVTGAVASDLIVTGLNGSFAAKNLGIEQTLASPATILTGTPLAPVGSRTDSIFSVLAEIRDALRSTNTVQRLNIVGDDLQRSQDLLLSAQAEIGGRVKRLDLTAQRHADEEVRLTGLISSLTDIDLAETITRLTQDQELLEASLRTQALTGRLSLFDFIG